MSSRTIIAGTTISVMQREKFLGFIHSTTRVVIHAGVLLGTMTSCGQSEVNQNSGNHIRTNGRSYKVSVAPNKIVFPKVKKGGKLQERFTAINDTENDVTIKEVETSCDCATVDGLPITIKKRNNAQLTVNFIADQDSNFLGNLEIELKGKNEVGGEVFKVLSLIEVVE